MIRYDDLCKLDDDFFYYRDFLFAWMRRPKRKRDRNRRVNFVVGHLFDAASSGLTGEIDPIPHAKLLKIKTRTVRRWLIGLARELSRQEG